MFRILRSSAARGHPIRQLKNRFSEAFLAAERSGLPRETLDVIFNGANLKQAALEGDVENGKVETGQSAGLIDEILPAVEVMKRLIAELEVARRRLADDRC